MTPLQAVQLSWATWLISWFAAAAWSDRTVKRPAVRRELLYRVLTIVGTMLLWDWIPGGRGVIRIWQPGPALAWSETALVVAGLAFTWWARLHLGRLWSSTVTRKEHHHVVDSGPYGLVRHPIYSGVLLAILATAALRGTAFALAGAGVLIASIYIKARVEEQFLREQLGTVAYDAYSHRVPMLVPFARRRHAGGTVP
jgi:protein-S-isoprenylcysteine O-methyltransferase Ste14